MILKRSVLHRLVCLTLRFPVTGAVGKVPEPLGGWVLLEGWITGDVLEAP